MKPFDLKYVSTASRKQMKPSIFDFFQPLEILDGQCWGDFFLNNMNEVQQQIKNGNSDLFRHPSLVEIFLSAT